MSNIAFSIARDRTNFEVVPNVHLGPVRSAIGRRRLVRLPANRTTKRGLVLRVRRPVMKRE